MQRVCLLAALAVLAAGHQPAPAEWMPGMAARRAAGPPPPPPALPPRDPDAEIIGPITDPRPIIDGNFQAPRGHRLAGVYRNDKPRLPDDYVRYLREQGLTPGQIEHGAGEAGSRLVRAPSADAAPPPAPSRAPSPAPAPAPGQVPLPGGFTLHLVPEPVPVPAELYSEVQTVPPPSVEHLRSAPAGRPSARHNEVGVTAAGGRPTPVWPSAAGFSKFPSMDDLRRHHQRVKQQLDEQWQRQLDQQAGALRRHKQSGGDAPVVRESYSVRQLPGGGRSVSYRKHTTHSTSYTTRGQPTVARVQKLQRRKRQPARRPVRFRQPRVRWNERPSGRW